MKLNNLGNWWVTNFLEDNHPVIMFKPSHGFTVVKGEFQSPVFTGAAKKPADAKMKEHKTSWKYIYFYIYADMWLSRSEKICELFQLRRHSFSLLNWKWLGFKLSWHLEPCLSFISCFRRISSWREFLSNYNVK